ncbi:MAG: chorismate-binding protein, partial [Rhodobacteraceae bacterium]|nr:chorismate-binding protein [Paracoccaceae bacterium]
MFTPSFEDFARGFDSGRNQIVCRHLAADLDTPVSLFMKLTKSGRHSFLLESVTGGEARGRYSIIGLEPDLLWTCVDGRASISRRDSKGRYVESGSSDQPFQSLRALLDECRIQLPEQLPSSSAGLFGYLGYDMVRLVEHLPDINADRIGTPDSVLMRPSIVVVLDWVKGEAMVVSPAWTSEGQSAQQAYNAALQRVGNTIRKINLPLEQDRQLTVAESPAAGEESETDKEDFLASVQRAKEYISAGDIFQVVLSQRWRKEFKLPSFSFYRALRRTNPSP